MIEVFFLLLQIILIDGLLSIDNAAALAAIASTLPKHQQNKALRAGILGAYFFRGLMIFIIGTLLLYPIIQLFAAGYLLYLVGTHFFGWKQLDFTFHGLSSFWKTVIMIEIADLAFSLDNVAAVVVLSNQLWIIILGVCISIFIMRFAAQLFIKLIAWEPLLEDGAFILILAIAIELICKYFGNPINSYIQFSISLLILLTTIIVGQCKRRWIIVWQ